MNRRTLFRLAAATGGWLLLAGHSPYRQWDVYRKARLFVLVNGEDAETVQLGAAIAALLAERLPASKAMLARARDIKDAVRLMASKQLDTAVLREEDAAAAFMGTGRFADGGKVPLRALAQCSAHVFVCRDDFPRSNGYQIAETMAEGWKEIDSRVTKGWPSPRPIASTPIPIHPGALDYHEDHPQPG
jgi:TRAP-type uncharacterized transport system substrate-binding protein